MTTSYGMLEKKSSSQGCSREIMTNKPDYKILTDYKNNYKTKNLTTRTTI